MSAGYVDLSTKSDGTQRFDMFDVHYTRDTGNETWATVIKAFEDVLVQISSSLSMSGRNLNFENLADEDLKFVCTLIFFLETYIYIHINKK